jgi:hypothetical protein
VEAQGTRIFYSLLVAGFAIELVGTVVTNLYYRYVLTPIVIPPSSGSPSQALELGASLLSFAFSPCLLFAAFYVLGRKVRLDEDWRSPVVSLFAGGAIAGALTVFAVSAINGSDFLSAITEQFGNGWNVASWALSIVEEGLFLIFVGLAAIYIASRHAGEGVSDTGVGASPQVG